MWCTEGIFLFLFFFSARCFFHVMGYLTSSAEDAKTSPYNHICDVLVWFCLCVNPWNGTVKFHICFESFEGLFNYQIFTLRINVFFLLLFNEPPALILAFLYSSLAVFVSVNLWILGCKSIFNESLWWFSSPRRVFFMHIFSVFLSSSNRKSSTASKHIGGLRKWRICQNWEITRRCSVREPVSP